MEFDYSSLKEKKAYKFFLPLIKTALNLRYKIEYDGLENIPEKEPFIIAANHIAFYDPILIAYAVDRPCHFMAKSELFKNKLVASFLKEMNVFPVKRGTAHSSSIEYAKRIIQNGWVLALFPEGTRSKDLKLKSAKNGVSYVAKKTNADVLPVSLYKENDSFQARGKITVRFGKIIKSADFGFDEEYKPSQIRAATKMIMNDIETLLKKGHLTKG